MRCGAAKNSVLRVSWSRIRGISNSVAYAEQAHSDRGKNQGPDDAEFRDPGRQHRGHLLVPL